ncbi:hypothetical protein DM02DRAFT_270057 [Periconia macrospinosa]|uniref:Uncharacterized protein n=1 Tax=Periconia macrospinosa TaxID=97972 RepID=A0A2V1D3M3_9PLEO|nr:hypothetical protein DM02DRAFT_270057 [Periconia macrospinosa]
MEPAHRCHHATGNWGVFVNLQQGEIIHGMAWHGMRRETRREWHSARDGSPEAYITSCSWRRHQHQSLEFGKHDAQQITPTGTSLHVYTQRRSGMARSATSVPWFFCHFFFLLLFSFLFFPLISAPPSPVLHKLPVLYKRTRVLATHACLA